MRASATCCGVIPCGPKKSGKIVKRNWPHSRHWWPSTITISKSILALMHRVLCKNLWLAPKHSVSDHRGSNSQVIDFESVKIYPIFTIKIENPGKSNAYQNLWAKPKKLTY